MKKRLCDLVEIIENNRRCVVLAVKESTQPLDLIKLGGFDGDETMFRVSKDPRTISVTIFRNGRPPYTMDFGDSTTAVSKHEMSIRDQVRECVNLDFGIFTNHRDIGIFNELVEKTCGERTLESERYFKLHTYADKNEGTLYVNGQYIASFNLDLKDTLLAARNVKLDVQQTEGTIMMGHVKRIEAPEQKKRHARHMDMER